MSKEGRDDASLIPTSETNQNNNTEYIRTRISHPKRGTVERRGVLYPAFNVSFSHNGTLPIPERLS